jgi:hypothetical protein
MKPVATSDLLTVPASPRLIAQGVTTMPRALPRQMATLNPPTV